MPFPQTERFEAATNEAPPPAPRWGRALLVPGGAALALSLGVILLTRPPLWLAGVLGVASGIAAVLVSAWLAHRTRPSAQPRALLLTDHSLGFTDGQAVTPVLSLDTSFGITLIANRARTRVAMVVTTTRETFYACADVPDDQRTFARTILASALTVASDERALDAAGPDGAPMLLSVDAFVRLHAALCRLDPASPSRMYLTDVRGEAVTLDGPRLSAGRRSFDLTAGLEWRGMLFRESSFGGGAAVYQGTHVRQGSTEIVFVSLMPALASPFSPGDVLATREPTLERAVLRDMQLMNESSGEPPPPELRVAVERVFMLPLRAALSTAKQRSSSQPDLGRQGRPLRAS